MEKSGKLVCDENDTRKRGGGSTADPKDGIPFFLGNLYGAKETKTVPGRREADSGYRVHVSRIPLFKVGPDPGDGSDTQAFQRVPRTSGSRRPKGSPDRRGRSGIFKTGLRGTPGATDGTLGSGDG